MHIVTLAKATTAPTHARRDEALIQAAIMRGPSASVWQMPDCLVVPRTYRAAANFTAVSNRFKQQGLPIDIRHSGGGVVPQGNGILNISLAWCQAGRPLAYSDRAYKFLCSAIGQILARFNVASHAQAIQGSFCDGRFNVASKSANGSIKKIAGTAQLWRHHRSENTPKAQQVVLVHALLLVACDISYVTAQANALEAALGHDRRYQVAAATTLHKLMGAAAPDGETLMQQVIHTSIGILSSLAPPDLKDVA